MRLVRVFSALLIGLLFPCFGLADVKLFVSVTPLKYFVERIGGEHVEVEVMVQPGHSPVTYEPTPRQMSALSTARAYIRIGVPFETLWMRRIQETNPELRIIDPRDGIDLLPMHYQVLDIGKNGYATQPHNHLGGDPHVWLDPSLVKTISSNIRDQLARIDQENSAAYKKNAEQFLKELDELDMDIRRLVANVENRKFLVFHPAWGYFARAYGLDQISVEHEGKEPGPRTLANLIEVVKRQNISTVFVQEQFSARVATALAAEIEGQVVVLDPLAEDYFENLREAARAISGAQAVSTHSRAFMAPASSRRSQDR